MNRAPGSGCAGRQLSRAREIQVSLRGSLACGTFVHASAGCTAVAILFVLYIGREFEIETASVAIAHLDLSLRRSSNAYTYTAHRRDCARLTVKMILE